MKLSPSSICAIIILLVPLWSGATPVHDQYDSCSAVRDILELLNRFHGQQFCEDFLYPPSERTCDPLLCLSLNRASIYLTSQIRYLHHYSYSSNRGHQIQRHHNRDRAKLYATSRNVSYELHPPHSANILKSY